METASSLELAPSYSVGFYFELWNQFLFFFNIDLFDFIAAEILDTIYQNKFTEPSPIQSQAWPVILSGMDCIGIAQVSL